MNTFEIFSGGGGLALGLQDCGFKCIGLLEYDKHACNTLKKNFESQVFEKNISDFDYSPIKKPVEMVAGGPPCQPFSLGGQAKGRTDIRDMFPEAINAINNLNPNIFLFENVKGLLRPSFSSYFEYILLRLTYPSIGILKNENWIDHLSRLEKIKSSGEKIPGEYQVLFRCLNAADYGVPQKRERVFFVGFKRELAVEWSFPEPTHSQDSLLYSKFVSKEYWDIHNVTPSPEDQKHISDGMLEKKLFNKFGFFTPTTLPWTTVRQALKNMPEPNEHGSTKFSNHILHRGARSYPGHTGSPLDEPSKALKAGVHGVPGGENTLRLFDGSVRYYTVREAARIQTFPDSYESSGARSESMRQIGNAVPVSLSRKLGKSILTALNY